MALTMFSCKENSKQDGSRDGSDSNYTQYVDPFIGTQNMGHTYPGATAPFGMVQLSPETNFEIMYIDGQYNPDTYRYCSGYQHDDSTIFGFSHTHFSGTGHSDLGDFLVMATIGERRIEPGNAKIAGSGYFSTFSHNSEAAEPGYYSVFLKDYSTLAEMTATERVGFHRYTFPKTDSAHIILDLMSNIYNHDQKNVWTFVRVENDSLVTGYRQTNGWGRTRIVYFAMQFSTPFTSYGHKRYDEQLYKGFYKKFDESLNFPEMAGKEIRAWFDFSTSGDKPVMIKFALSSVSTAGALNNLQDEIPDWDFDKSREATSNNWNRELAQIEIETLLPEQKESFYTALYHSMLSPIIYEDSDGSYRGIDQNIHKSEGFTNYTIFSLWDTFRSLHPLFNLLQPSRNNDMVKSMMAHYKQSVHKMLPVWSHYANENWCMIGYHSVSVIADALVKGTTDIDVREALEASIYTSTVGYYDGLDSYMARGYVAEDLNGSSVSKTLEYAYDDWAIAQVALIAGDTSNYNLYTKRAASYINNYDVSTGFMRPRLSDGGFKKEFDPLDTHGQGFIEGNAWTYSLFVPHDVDGMIEMMGGEERFIEHVDSLFTMELDDKYIEQTEDITRDGIIGNYVHGNEPGHHIPYLYNWTSSAWKTQERVRMIMDSMYGNGVDGLCGNDDAGQMSAWYIFSSLGFYPVAPGSEMYALGSPMVVSATINFENRKVLKISTVNQSAENVYVEKVTLNGVQVDSNFISHRDITGGGELMFFMSSERAGV
jgi:predicted alpha-1,2-mannosidase